MNTGLGEPKACIAYGLGKSDIPATDAELARWNLSFGQIFAVVAVPGLVAAAALLVKQFAHPESRNLAIASTGEVMH